MDSVVDNYVLIDGELERDLERIEQQVFTGSFDIDATAIYRLKREVLEFRRAAIPCPPRSARSSWSRVWT